MEARMIRIDGPGRTGPVAGGSGPRKADGPSSFRLPDGGSRAAGPLAVGGPTDVASLMALQEVEDPTERKRRSVKRGRALLDELEQLKLELLAGTILPGRLETLTTLLAGREPSGDDGLDRVLDDIDLRVRVELAKSGRYPD
jgi:hypothetical protein